MNISNKITIGVFWFLNTFIYMNNIKIFGWIFFRYYLINCILLFLESVFLKKILLTVIYFTHVVNINRKSISNSNFYIIFNFYGDSFIINYYRIYFSRNRTSGSENGFFWLLSLPNTKYSETLENFFAIKKRKRRKLD